RRIQAHRQGRQGGLDPRLLQSGDGRHRQADRRRQVRDRRHRREAPERRPRRPDRRHRQGAGGDRVQHGRHDHHGQRELPAHARLHAGRDQGQAPQHVRRDVRAREPGLSRVLGGAEPGRVPGGRIQAHRQGRQGSLHPGVLQSDLRSQRQAVQGRQICLDRDRGAA
ncbi:hypothetical protein KXV85_004439, partial [Aspergillus fumigatus]